MNISDMTNFIASSLPSESFNSSVLARVSPMSGAIKYAVDAVSSLSFAVVSAGGPIALDGCQKAADVVAPMISSGCSAMCDELASLDGYGIRALIGTTMLVGLMVANSEDVKRAFAEISSFIA